DNPSSTPPLR
nr:RecName: Full=48 kDa cell wall protein [Arabidopsis thaliana]